MKILNEKPPEWIMTGCLNQFRININTTFWTYGDTIYNPGGIHIPDHVMAHEETHIRQQESCDGGKDTWWKRYLAEPRFRLEQELEAYTEQYKFFCSHQKDRNHRSRFLDALSYSLSSPLYQLAVTKQQARSMILVLSGQKTIKQVTN